MKTIRAAGVLQLSLAIEANQNTTDTLSTSDEGKLSGYPVYPKVIAMKESLAMDGISFLHLWRSRLNRTLVKIDTGHRLIDLQGPWLVGRGIDMVPIEKTESHIAVFLHFKNHDITQ